jgi:hypothetical protein
MPKAYLFFLGLASIYISFSSSASNEERDRLLLNEGLRHRKLHLVEKENPKARYNEVASNKSFKGRNVKSDQEALSYSDQKLDQTLILEEFCREISKNEKYSYQIDGIKKSLLPLQHDKKKFIRIAKLIFNIDTKKANSLYESIIRE